MKITNHGPLGLRSKIKRSAEIYFGNLLFHHDNFLDQLPIERIMLIELKNPKELFGLNAGDSVYKKNLYDLIQHSKIPGSQYWAGEGLSGISNQQILKGVL